MAEDIVLSGNFLSCNLLEALSRLFCVELLHYIDAFSSTVTTSVGNECYGLLQILPIQYSREQYRTLQFSPLFDFLSTRSGSTSHVRDSLQRFAALLLENALSLSLQMGVTSQELFPLAVLPNLKTLSILYDTVYVSRKSEEPFTSNLPVSLLAFYSHIINNLMVKRCVHQSLYSEKAFGEFYDFVKDGLLCRFLAHTNYGRLLLWYNERKDVVLQNAGEEILRNLSLYLEETDEWDVLEV
jgi:hypothetical protein